jgi:hypothetical protein
MSNIYFCSFCDNIVALGLHTEANAVIMIFKKIWPIV